jgi:ATP-dependent exoDNAse (exonuclease V) alpha subunit
VLLSGWERQPAFLQKPSIGFFRFDPTLGRFTVNAENPLDARFLVVDEASMLDSKLAAALLRAVPSVAHVLLVEMLSSYHPSAQARFKDLIRSELPTRHAAKKNISPR